MVERRYFVSFLNKQGGNIRNSWRELIWQGDFVLEDVTKFLEKKNNCIDVCILNFKELEKYEYAESQNLKNTEGEQ